ncbi:hypothetical protein GW17_00042664, partial [Ensete ventricosum]
VGVVSDYDLLALDSVSGYWYVDRPLSSGTAKINRWQSISAIDSRLRKKSAVDGRLREKRRRGKEERIPRAVLGHAVAARGSPAHRCRPHPWVTRKPTISKISFSSQVVDGLKQACFLRLIVHGKYA